MTLGQAISADVPAVTGAVTSYSVNPALPAGLSLNTTTGEISGTPTVVAAQASYTVTASNAAGTTTAVVQILVNPAIQPPSSLSYPQTNIVASVGQTIASDIPAVAGTVTAFSVSPTLPAGFTFSTTSGAISGAGTSVSPQTTYTVTASNAGGSTTATLAVTVNKALTSLLDVGHANQLNLLRVNATRVLSQDVKSHWALWDYTADTEIVSGDQQAPPDSATGPWPADMENQVVAIGQTNGVDLLATSDGHLLTEIQTPEIDSATLKSWWKLATDGSYICSGSKNGLNVWTSTGQQLFTHQGDYSSASAFATPSQVLIALGPAGQNVIETISIPAGTSSVGSAFSGTFNSWFLDGQHFLSNTGTTVWVYDAAVSTQPTPISVSTVENLTGQGNWFWTMSASSTPYQLNVYSVSSGALAATYPFSVLTTAVPSGTTIGVFSGTASASVIDLSGTAPTKVDYPLPIAYESAYAAVSSSQWMIGNFHGVLLDGPSASTTPRYFGTGQIWSMAGSQNLVAIATADGNIRYYSPALGATSAAGTISFPSSKIALSSDGTVLVAAANANDAQYEPDRSLKVFSIPSNTLTYNIPYTLQEGAPTLFDFSLSASGSVTGQYLGTLGVATASTFTWSAAPTLGGATIWSESAPNPVAQNQIDEINLSPDGTLIAVSNGPPDASATTTQIFKNGVLQSAVNGFAVGWIDNNQLLVNNYASQGTSSIVYTNASIYSSSGALTSTPTLPELFTIQPVSSNSIYSPALNTIFSLPSGTVLYSSGTPVTGPAAISGSYVVFTSGSQVVIDSQ